MPIAGPEERALVTLIAEAERAGRPEEALRLAEEKQSIARERLGIQEGALLPRPTRAILPNVETELPATNRPRSPVTDRTTVDLSMALTRFLALPEGERQLLLAAGAHFEGERVVTERLPVGVIAKLPAALREAQR